MEISPALLKQQSTLSLRELQNNFTKNCQSVQILNLSPLKFEAYNSVGMVADLGAFYQDTSGTFSLSLVLRNVGAQFSKYGENREKVPFDLQIGLSKRLKHLTPAIFCNLPSIFKALEYSL